MEPFSHDKRMSLIYKKIERLSICRTADPRGIKNNKSLRNKETNVPCCYLDSDHSVEVTKNDSHVNHAFILVSGHRQT